MALAIEPAWVPPRLWLPDLYSGKESPDAMDARRWREDDGGTEIGGVELWFDIIKEVIRMQWESRSVSWDCCFAG